MDNLLGLKLLILGFAVVIGYHMLRLALMGRRLAGGPLDDTTLMEDKRSTWTCMAWLLLCAIALIEMAVHASSRGAERSPLFYVHLAAAVSYLLLILFLRWQTGRRSKNFHRIAGYTAAALFVAAFSTGSVLLAPL